MNLVGDYLYMFGGQLQGEYKDILFAMNVHSCEIDYVEYANNSNHAPEGRAFHSY